MSINEKWRWVPGYEGLYMVSSLGNVMAACSRRGSQPFKPLRKSRCGSGYLKVSLRRDGLASNVMVHRIVAAAFIPNPEGKDQVNHIDGNKENNSVRNLEWVTRSENQLHSYRVLGNVKVGVHRSVKLSEDDVLEIFSEQGTAASIARRHGISDTMVLKIKKGECWGNVTCRSTE